MHGFTNSEILSVLGLEGSADSVGGGGSAGRTNVNMLRGAIALSIVISTVLYGTVDALDVLVATFVFRAIVHFR